MRQEPAAADPLQRRATDGRYGGRVMVSHGRATEGAPKSAREPTAAAPPHARSFPGGPPRRHSVEGNRAGSLPSPPAGAAAVPSAASGGAVSPRPAARSAPTSERRSPRGAAVLPRHGPPALAIRHEEQSPGVGDYSGAYQVDSRGRKAAVGAPSRRPLHTTFGSGARTLQLHGQQNTPGVGAYNHHECDPKRKANHSKAGSPWSCAPERKCALHAGTGAAIVRLPGCPEPTLASAPPPRAPGCTSPRQAAARRAAAAAVQAALRSKAAARSRSASAPERAPQQPQPQPVTRSSLWLQSLGGGSPPRSANCDEDARTEPVARPPPPSSAWPARTSSPPPPATTSELRSSTTPGPSPRRGSSPPTSARRPQSPPKPRADSPRRPAPAAVLSRVRSPRQASPPPGGSIAGRLTKEAMQVYNLLASLRLEGYFGVLEADGWDDMRSLRAATEQELTDLGLKKGHRVRLLRELRLLPPDPLPRPAQQQNGGTPELDPHHQDRVLLDP
eukprot:TRINITY_DN5915_c2_g1_i1.p1 TRINITY_DN5915_c2_g1~~TRINITY_DN5915_c2_g1_i1.p1  ORF type:complete len:530 (+),score=89.68 TRINITY_DN5915_c2_g1_i1:83-1591(+)